MLDGRSVVQSPAEVELKVPAHQPVDPVGSFCAGGTHNEGQDDERVQVRAGLGSVRLPSEIDIHLQRIISWTSTILRCLSPRCTSY